MVQDERIAYRVTPHVPLNPRRGWWSITPGERSEPGGARSSFFNPRMGVVETRP